MIRLRMSLGRLAIWLAKRLAGDMALHEAGRAHCRERVRHIKVLQDGEQSRALTERVEVISEKIRIPTLRQRHVTPLIPDAAEFDRPLYRLVGVKATYRRVADQ